MVEAAVEEVDVAVGSRRLEDLAVIHKDGHMEVHDVDQEEVEEDD